MFYTLGLKKLPFKQDTRQIIYVENRYDEVINTLIQIHYLDIYYYFDSKGYEFCYLPWQTRKIEEGDEGRYFAPYRDKDDNVVIKSDFILNYMVHPENRRRILPSLLFYDPSCDRKEYYDADCQFTGLYITTESFEKSSDLSTILDDIISHIRSHQRKSIPTIRFQKVSNEDLNKDGEDGILYRPSNESEIGAWVNEPEANLQLDADYLFDTESKVLIDEIIERIEKLNKKGINDYIIQQVIKCRVDRLSRLQITKDFRLILNDYQEMEINMTPLPKAVFLLFLRYPEGIVFKHLPDYQDELFDIYKKLKGPYINYETAKKSIEDVTNPLGNSINEKCARIREAFVSQFDERLAKYYYVDGKRGEPKKIALPRDLVKWED